VVSLSDGRTSRPPASLAWTVFCRQRANSYLMEWRKNFFLDSRLDNYNDNKKKKKKRAPTT